MCEALPKLKVDSPLALVMHPLEQCKTTNTGYLAYRTLAPSRLIVGRDAVPEFAPESTIVLHPSASRPIRPSDRGKTLVALDGTWKQAGRMARRWRGLAHLPKVALPERSRQSALRNASDRGQVSTLQALAIAYGILEGPKVEAALSEVLREFASRASRLRGKKESLLTNSDKWTQEWALDGGL